MAKKKKSNSLYTILIIVGVVICIAFSIMNSRNSENDSKNASDNTQATSVSATADMLKVNFIDVGQGDCEYIILPNGKTMLIDSGERDMAEVVKAELDSLGCKTIDMLVITHPHTDHMGCMSEVIESYDIGEIYMPRATATSKTYEKLLKTIKSNGLKVNTAKAGKVIYQEDDIIIEILSPLRDEYEDLNNYSAVIKLTYGKSTFLFTGDAEKIVEQDMLEKYGSQLDADVLKVGHHGSRYSSSKEFLEAVSPEYAIIECGEGNSYGHPHDQALKRLGNVNSDIYRTDKNGTICISTNGDGVYDIDTEK